MKKAKLFLVSLIFLFSVNAFSQNVLTGKITNALNGNPLSGAVIYIPDLKTGAAAKQDGSYEINDIPAGTYLVQTQILGYADQSQTITIKGTVSQDFSLSASAIEENEVVITGNSIAKDIRYNPQPITEVSKDYLNEHSSTNVIDGISNVPGVSAMTNGQSISKPVIRGLGYNRVLTVNDGVEQVDQVWFDEFGIEADPDAVDRYEILKGPGSLAYGSDAISGVVNLIPEQPLPPGQTEGDILFNYQTNNGLINNMAHIAGTSLSGIAWSARMDNIMAHAYRDPYDGFVLNSQFSNFNADGTIGIHRSWGYTQIHAGYFDMATGIVDGTRDSLTGIMMRQVSYPDLNGGDPTYIIPTNVEQASYTPFCINQRIRHTKVVWDNSVAVGNGRITGIFSWQENKRQETNDPTIPNTPDIYYHSEAATYDARYISPQMGGFNISGGVNGVYQNSESLGTLMLIPNYNFFQIGAFAIANEKINNLNLSGGIRYDTRTFNGIDHWVDSTTQAPAAPDAPDAFHEFQGFTTTFSGVSGSLGATYDLSKSLYIKANIARGWRAPSVVECAANGVHDGTVVYEIGDNTLTPETSLEEDLTFGIKSKDLDFEIDAFNNGINDFIYAQGLHSVFGGDSINNSLNAAGLGAAPVYKYTQGKAQLYGGEVTLDIHPASVPWLDFNSTLSLVYGGLLDVPDTLKFLPFVPPTRITADLRFPISKICEGIKNAYLKVGILSCFQQSNVYRQFAIYSGLSTALTPFEYYASTHATAGYTLLNAGLGGDVYSGGNKIFEVYVICNNVLNTSYIDYMSRFKYDPVNYTTGRVGVFNMGRNFSVKFIIPIAFRNKQMTTQD